jgi:hypothetical protein
MIIEAIPPHLRDGLYYELLNWLTSTERKSYIESINIRESINERSKEAISQVVNVEARQRRERQMMALEASKRAKERAIMEERKYRDQRIKKLDGLKKEKRIQIINE